MMTQRQYIKSVSRKLHLPEMLKQTVLEDLKESFDAAYECGESTESVIERLGTPRDFVDEVLQSAELSEKQRVYLSRAKVVNHAIVTFATIASVFTIYYVIRYLRMMTIGVIGYSDSPTEIQILSDFASALPIVGGIALWLIPVALTIYLLFIKRQINTGAKTTGETKSSVSITEIATETNILAGTGEFTSGFEIEIP